MSDRAFSLFPKMLCHPLMALMTFSDPETALIYPPCLLFFFPVGDHVRKFIGHCSVHRRPRSPTSLYLCCSATNYQKGIIRAL